MRGRLFPVCCRNGRPCDCLREVADSGRSVILDASFRSRAMRDRARLLAEKHGIPFIFDECRATVEECKRRLKERARSPSGSDGSLAIFDELVARFEPFSELTPKEHFVVDTTGSAEESLKPLLNELPVWPERFVG